MNKTLASSIIVALGFFAIFVFTWPSYGQMMDARSDLQDAKDLLEIKEQAQANISVLAKELQDNRNVANRLALFLPENERVDFLITSMEAAVTRSRVNLISISLTPEPSAIGSDYTNLKVGVSLTGRYTDFLNFLDTIEESLRLYDIIDLSMSGGEDGPLNIQVTIRTYFLNK